MKLPKRYSARILISIVFVLSLAVLLYSQNKSAGLYPSARLGSAARPHPAVTAEKNTPVAAKDPTVNTPATSLKSVSIPILMYHELGEGPNCMYVAVQDFYAQMKYLHDNGYQAVSLAQARDILNSKGNSAKKVVITFDDGYESFYTRVWPVLKEFDQTATVFVISGLIGHPNYLTWDQIKALTAAGVEIGGHTRTHRFLTDLSSSEAQAEIAGGKSDIETQLGQSIISFCYPTGKYNRQVVSQVQAAGYTAAVTMEQKEASSSDNLLLLPRWGVYKGDPLSCFIGLLGK